jgi:hypothetical protein
MDDKPREELERRMDELARKYAETHSGSDKPPPRRNAGPLKHPQHALFHLQGLPGRSVKHRLEIGPATFPGHLNGFAHRIGHDDKLGRPSVLLSPKCHDVDLDRQNRVEDSRKQSQETRAWKWTAAPLALTPADAY